MARVIKPPQAEREAFGRRLAEALTRSPRSRTDLAERLGVHYNTIGFWLRAESDCPVGWIPVLAKALGVPPQDLVQDPSPPRAPQPTDDDLARKVVTALEGPLSAPDLMALLAEAKRHLV